MKPPADIASEDGPVCRHLRARHAYIPALAGGAKVQAGAGNDQTFYWCNRTLSALGADDGPVQACQCRPARPCHEA
jgi:hypothetical protein